MANTPNTSRIPGLSVRLISWNIKGMGNPVKRSKVLTHLKRLDTDVAFLQETHLCNKDHARLTCPWADNIFHSNFNSKARGVAVLINKRVQFSFNKVIADKDGRYLIIVGTLLQNPVVLVNVYAPNFDDPMFMKRLFEKLPSLNDHQLIFGGDLNCVIDPKLDRSNPRTLIQSSMSKVISEFMAKNGCADPWRFFNSQVQEFSFFSRVHQSYSRIDYFFMDSTLMSKVISTE